MAQHGEETSHKGGQGRNVEPLHRLRDNQRSRRHHIVQLEQCQRRLIVDNDAVQGLVEGTFKLRLVDPTVAHQFIRTGDRWMPLFPTI